MVTRGVKGASAITRAGEQLGIAPPCSLVPVVDTVGAGDTFASVIMLGIFHAWPLQLSMDRAQRFASAVVGVAGATRMNKAFSEPFIETWFSGTN